MRDKITMNHPINLIQEIYDCTTNLCNMWEVLQVNRVGSRVTAKTMQQTGAIVEDISGFITLLIETHNRCHILCAKENAFAIGGIPSNIKSISKSGNQLKEHQKQFAVCFKGIFIVLRSFQDRILCILQEIRGETSGRGTSMSNKLKNFTKDPLGSEINSKIPNYFDWFLQFRDLRNKMKYGLEVYSGFHANKDELLILLNIREVRQKGDRKVYALTEALSLRDILEAIIMSTLLLSFAKSTLKVG
jgi:hypothetical protein